MSFLQFFEATMLLVGSMLIISTMFVEWDIDICYTQAGSHVSLRNKTVVIIAVALIFLAFLIESITNVFSA